MSDYRIIVTPDAIRDLTELRDYIADVLLAPETALACIQTIRREIGSLARMPARRALAFPRRAQDHREELLRVLPDR